MTKPSEFDPEYVRDISLDAYLDRLGPDGIEKAAAKFEGGEAEFYKVMRARAASHDSLTKAYLRAIQAKPIPPIPQVTETKIEVLDPAPFVLEEVPIKVRIRGRKSSGYTPNSTKKTK